MSEWVTLRDASLSLGLDGNTLSVYRNRYESFPDPRAFNEQHTVELWTMSDIAEWWNNHNRGVKRYGAYRGNNNGRVGNDADIDE